VERIFVLRTGAQRLHACLDDTTDARSVYHSSQ
jgi:hypothetical protein